MASIPVLRFFLHNFCKTQALANPSLINYTFTEKEKFQTLPKNRGRKR